MDERADVIVVPRLFEPDGGLDAADADDASVRAFDQHEHVTRVGAIGRARERCERALDARREALAIGGKRRQSGAGTLGEREHGGKIVARDGPDEEHRSGRVSR